MNRISRAAVSLAALTAVLLMGQPANATSPSVARAATPVERCVAEADRQNYDTWTCLGGTVTYLDTKPETQRDSIAERGDSNESSADQAGWVTRVVAPNAETTSTSSNDAVSVMSDDWDSWCETGSICHRRVSSYISETKGNGAYGDQNGAIGSFDLILKTNLNGRQPRYNVGLLKDTGPNLSVDSQVNCVKDQTFDGTCGQFDVPTVYIGTYRSGLIYGNRIADNAPDNYFSTLTGNFTPDGYGTRSFATLRSQDFICPSGSGNCTF